jgi:hypothetical protein
VTRPLSRRTFLLGAVATAGVTACGTSKSKATSPSGSAGTSGTSSSVITVGSSSDAASQLNLLETSDPAALVSGVEERLAFVLRAQDFIRPVSPVTIAIGPGLNADHLGQPVVGVIHTDSYPAPSYVTTTYRFPGPGDYWVRATYEGKTADAPLQGIADPITTQVLIAGKAMVNTTTPTFANHRGVEPICTRSPTCPWHGVSLDAALAEHRPIALLFATPKLCQTATCGPVLEQLLTLKAQFEGRIRFLHSEIYTDGTAQANAPAVIAYRLTSEPVLFLAGADGIIKDRIDGLFGHAEASAALTKLAAG